MLGLTRDAFDQQGIQALVGAGCSSATQVAAQVAGSVNVPIISPSATSPSLSDGRSYPYFFRTLPSDAFGAVAMVDVLVHLLTYSSSALVSSTDVFGAGGATAFNDAALNSGLGVTIHVTFRKDSDDFSTQHRQLIRSSARVIALFAPASDGAEFMRTAHAAGAGGAGYLWMLGSPSLTAESLWVGDNDEEAALLRLGALKGLFALQASNGNGTDAHSAYMSRRRLLPPTTAADGTCSLEMDDEGATYLWGQDLDSLASTAL
eukprot:43511-Prymnesium_polylepis.1